MSDSDIQHRQFLRRGEHHAAATLPVGPSIIFDESRDGGGGAIATIDTSQSIVLATPLSSRHRPRFATAQDLDDALLQAIEGKITRKNAWASKDASNLLEGITHTIESTLEAAGASDEYSSFAKVATVVEGCSKVWTSRVDSTYQRSNQMVRRLLRNEEGGTGSEDDADAEKGGDDDLAGAAAGAAERRKKAAQRRGQPIRTLALDPSEINLDSRGRIALAQVGVNAQFRAITEKFDQGNAQGLLLNNAPLGCAGNLILDVDYSRDKDGEPRRSVPRSAVSSRRTSGRVKDEPLDNNNQNDDERNTSAKNGGFPSEIDQGLYTRFELPPFPQPTIVDASEHNSVRTSGNLSRSGDGAVKHEDTEAGRPSVILPSLLMLPRTLDRDGVEESGDAAGAQQGSFVGTETNLNNNNQNDDDEGHDNGNDDWYDDDGMDYTGYNGESSFVDSTAENSANSGNASANLSGANVAAEARNLVTGAAELNALDGCLFGEKRLALEADDPTSWFPLSEPPANAFGGVPHNSELRRLHREHHLTHSATSPSMIQSGVGVNTKNASGNGAKKAKREKTIVFDLPGELAATTDESQNSTSFFQFGSSTVDSSALKQSATAGKNVTPLGKELLLGKDPNAVMAFTQSSVQRKRAQEAGLLLPDPPVPGKTIPSYLPYPIVVPAFFQPFSTSLMQWNMLRKSATGHTMALASAAPSRRASAGGANVGWGERDYTHMLNSRTDDIGVSMSGDDGAGADGAGLGDMPVEFFHGGAEADDEYMGAGGFHDDYDAHSDGEESVRLAQEQILEGFERAELARTSGTQTAASRYSGGVATTDPVQLVRVLHNTQAALPAQVDVVRLRQAMWTSLSDAIKRCPALLGDASRESQRIDGNKRQARKRGRAEEAEDKGESEDVADTTQLPRFSDVVMSVLPHVTNGISTSGTLSPAFFFFSILFLANERGVLLESVPGLDDLIIRGVDHSAVPATDGQ